MITAVLQKIAIRPNKIVFYNEYVRAREPQRILPEFPTSTNNVNHQGFLNLENNPEVDHTTTKQAKSPILKNYAKKQVQANKHNFEISQKAAANIKSKVMWLYQLSKSKTVISPGAESMFSFRMNFITLTLPSTQVHQSSLITKKCLNQFLTEMKELYNLQNYVWRLEFQRNGNLHYHIASDCYIPYEKCISVWNRCLNKLGYVDTYQQKFYKMSFREYYHLSIKQGTTSIKTIRRRFKKGTAFNWTNPNTVDVRSVQSAKNISFYIAKYITKNSKDPLNKVVQEREDSETNLRLWFCSRSLSACKAIVHYIEQHDTLVEDFYNSIKKGKKYVFDYCSVIFYNFNNEDVGHKKLANLLFNKYARFIGYCPS